MRIPASTGMSKLDGAATMLGSVAILLNPRVVSKVCFRNEFVTPGAARSNIRPPIPLWSPTAQCSAVKQSVCWIDDPGSCIGGPRPCRITAPFLRLGSFHQRPGYRALGLAAARCLHELDGILSCVSVTDKSPSNNPTNRCSSTTLLNPKPTNRRPQTTLSC